MRSPEETARLAATVTVETRNGLHGLAGVMPVRSVGPGDPIYSGSWRWLSGGGPYAITPEETDFEFSVVLAADLAEARAEVAALRQEHEAEANAWEREVDVARHQIAALREAVALMAEWQAAAHDRRDAIAELKNAERDLEDLRFARQPVTESERAPYFDRVWSGRKRLDQTTMVQKAIEARMLAATLPGEVDRG